MNDAIIFLEPKGTILEVVRSAKKRGFSVIAFTTDLENIHQAPKPYRTAKSSIDRIVQIKSWQDEDTVEAMVDQIQSEFKIVGVYSGLEATMKLGAVLRLKYGLPSPSKETVEIILDKYKLRKKLAEHDLSSISALNASEISVLKEWPFKNGAYFKPRNGCFSAYVEKCESLKQVNAAIKKYEIGGVTSLNYVNDYVSKYENYMLEEEFEGELLSVEAISSNGEFTSIGLLSRILYSKNPVVEMGSCFPYKHLLEEQIIETVRKAHQVIGFTDGPSHTEVIVSSSGEVEVIDLNPRFVGADVLHSINNALEIKIEDSLVDYATGNSISINQIPKNYSCIQYFLAPMAEKLTSIHIPEYEEIKFSSIFRSIGEPISRKDSQLDYLGCYLTVMPTFDEAIQRSRAMRGEIRINENLQGVY